MVSNTSSSGSGPCRASYIARRLSAARIQSSRHCGALHFGWLCFTSERGFALPRHLVQPIGYLDVHLTPFGHRILPLLARVQPGFAPRFNEGEVDDAFEVPLAFLMTPQNHKCESRNWNGLTISL
jgi:hypothetical protein